jgi:hypothetical protein
VRIPRGEGLFRAARGGLLAQHGELEEARVELERAGALLSSVSDPNYLVILDLHRRELDLARGGDSEVARAALVALETTKPPGDVRFAMRMLRRALGAGTPRRGSLALSPDGCRCRLPSGEELDLGRRGSMRRILLALADQRRRAPGIALGSDALLAAGWPGERVLAEAGSKRVRVAIASLRKMGFEGLLLTRDDGYLLDPSVAMTYDQASA